MKYFSKIIAALFLLSIASCVKQEFDEPPLGGTPTDVVANYDIADLKALHNEGEFEVITEDWIIGGEVVMDDRTGNFYKTLAIQDGTAGIQLSFNDGFLYTDFPIGRQLFVNLKGMVLSDYNGLISVIGDTLSTGSGVEEIGITAIQRETALFKGQIAQDKVAPAVRTIASITDADVSTLISLSDVEFRNGDQGAPFADAINNITLNRVVQDCQGNQVLMRTSGYSDFAATLTPEGRGTLVGVLSKFRDDYQFYIRDLDDVADMTNARCGSGPIGGDLTQVDISVVRSTFAGSPTTAPAESKVKGIVVSDFVNGNITGRNLVVQDGTAGVVIRFDDNHPFELGDEIEVDISNVEISDFNGLVQLNNVSLGRASKIGTGTAMVRTTTIAELKANFDAWESTVVKIIDAELEGAATFSGTLTVDDGTSTIPMFTRFGATFADDATPTGKVDVVALVGDFNGIQLNMRNRDDVTGGTVTPPNPGGGGLVDEDFSSGVNNEPVSVSDWINFAEAGTRVWQAKEFDGNVYAQATSYNSTDPNEDMWLITPELDLATQRTLTFETAKAFFTHDGLTVYVSTDFDGTNVASATWTILNANLASASDDDHAFVPSGDVMLPIAAKGYVAFRYEGNAASDTGTFRIDNVLVK